MSLDKNIKQIMSKMRQRGDLCAFQTLVDNLSQDDQKTLAEALNKNISANVIVKALRADGHKVTPESMRNHRQGTCRCPKNGLPLKKS